LTGPTLSWLAWKGFLPGVSLAQTLVGKCQIGADEVKSWFSAELQEEPASAIHANGREESEAERVLRELTLDAVRDFGSPEWDSRSSKSRLTQHRHPLSSTDSLLADFVLRLASWLDCSLAQIVLSATNDLPAVARKVPERVQRQLLLMRECMARVAWGSRGGPAREQMWGDAERVLLEVAPLATRRKAEEYDKYRVVLLARLSGGRATDMRSLVVPEKDLPEALESLASRFARDRWGKVFVTNGVPVVAKVDNPEKAALNVQEVRVKGFGLCEVASRKTVKACRTTKGTKWMQRLQRWLQDSSRLKGLLEGKKAREQCPAALPSREWQNVDLAQYSFLFGRGTRKQWREHLFIPLIQALLSPLPPKQG